MTKGGKEMNKKKINMKPEILSQPNIPKPLHGIAPRTIMGQEWWDRERQKVYASTDYCCIACGVSKSEAKGYRWLEAHEYWDIDYLKGVCKVVSIEPLCHYCHNFIHSGRLNMIIGSEKSEEEVIAILEHGFKVLANNKLKCFYFTLELAKQLGAKTYGVKAYKSKQNPKIKWNDWKLIFKGKEYKSKFKDIDEWAEYYQV
jgi:hypothetical protein